MFLIYFLWLILPLIATNQLLNQNQPIIQEIALPKIVNLNQVRLNCDLEQGTQPINFD